MGHFIDLTSKPESMHHPAVVLLKAQIFRFQSLPGQKLGHTTHIAGNGHPVIVEDDQQLLTALPGVGQSLIGQTAGEGSVSDQSEHLVVLSQSSTGLSHAQRHRHRVGGVPGNECVVYALIWLRESGNAAVLPQGRHLLPASGEHLVQITLVSHIKDQSVPAGIKHPMDGHGELHCAQVGCQMSSGSRDIPHQFFPKLGTKHSGLLIGQVLQNRSVFSCLIFFCQGNPSHLPSAFTGVIH